MNSRSPFLFPIVFFFVATAVALAQDLSSPPSAQTHVAAVARFEIIQSGILRKETFKLDKETGRVWQLVKTTKGDSAWEPMFVIDLPKANHASSHYQIYLSGLMAKDAFLLDVDTGLAWRLTCLADSNGQDESCAWVPMRDLAQ